MKHADLTDLESRIAQVVRASEVADRVTSISIEPGEDDDGVEFLRVVLHFASAPNLTWATFQRTVRAIEDEVASVDERFPSVRIAA